MSISKMLFLFSIVLLIRNIYGTLLRIGTKKKVNQIPLAPVVVPAEDYNTEAIPSQVTGYKENRIIGGELTDIEKFPYLVDIQSGTSHSCGGAYIRKLWILTAAHCLTFRKKVALTCSMGSTYLDDNNKQQRNATAIYPHRNYNPRNDSNDIGLIKISKPFKLSSRIRIVDLATKPINSFVKCTVAGWGVIHQEDMRDRSKLSNQLRFVEIPLISQDRCGELYYIDKFRKHFMTDLVFCAGYEEGGFDACQGDSGGPFVCNNVLVGIVSWGIGCGNELPGVYTNVTSYLSWITAIMNYGRKERRLQYNSSELYRRSSILFAFLIYLLMR